MSTKQLYQKIHQRLCSFQPIYLLPNKITPPFHHQIHTKSNNFDDSSALKVQTLLKTESHKPLNDIFQSLNQCNFTLSEDFILDVLKRHRSDWKPAFTFFKWVLTNGNSPKTESFNEIVENTSTHSPKTGSFNEILDILGRMRRFQELNEVLDEMSERGKNLVNERTYGIVINRYCGAHRVEDAIEFFYKRKVLGLELDLIAFQTLLVCLCRFKHVEAAEFLFHNKKNEFKDCIKTRNIILNGWCVLGSLREAKRFWNDIVTSKLKPDKFTYGIFINSLCKSGKISTAVKLFQTMWEKGCKPDVAICNCIIDGLCFKKRIPEALEIFREMNERDCLPDVATYNSLIKNLCKIRRMEKVYELLDEMETKGESCLPNARTYGYLLNSAKSPEEAIGILERMNKNECKMTGDIYNLLLRLFMSWDNQGKVKSTWDEMERSGLGPDQRSYTIMIHGLFEGGRLEDALLYFNEMISKSMVPEPRTRLLVDAMNIKLKEKGKESKKVEVMKKGRKDKNTR
ncbi:putative pentatricopeptide repeat-containing protein At3g15200 [Lycium ferocissimum]|uniref:putative pentatricopeptide repeat-containing protein At3g15200 n=1 Tax=Lycium ferocissimum TaxID=112874 RepID=UPI002814E0D2|nr:putative pentatricopeptide repeat-containing protein At3g15200 [Lycium ferocissimum]